MRCVVSIAILVGLGGAAGQADAEPRLKVKHKRDLPITLIGGVVFGLADTVGKDALSPARCRWCVSNPVDRGVRDGLRWSSTHRADQLSNLSAYVAVPIATFGTVALLTTLDGREGELIDNGVIIAETAVLALGVNYTVKALVGRERPDVHALAPGDKASTPDPAENNLSFFSGHSTLAMTLAVAAGTTASLRGYRHARWVWATAVPLALATGYLRIAADRHWATDVATGWAFGAAFGVGVPWLLHRTEAPTPTPVLGRAGGATTVGVALAW
ncbi:MAG: phosphatase PAP2 family protein [Myxococcales bacterium]|nr:phosphatase PAP2 family protein [Myxococcales bacterium]